MKMKPEQKLDMWQRRLSHDQDRWNIYADKFDRREDLIRGSHEVLPCCENDTKKSTPHVRNIVAELIESQVDTALPMPKVQAKREEDEELAKMVEDMLINELDRMPMEINNDMMERTVPTQGGAFYWLEWDNGILSSDGIGDLMVQTLHPKQVVPQDGVVSSIEDMDYIILKIPQTKEYIKNTYNVNVKDEGEEEPEVRSFEDQSPASGMVTQYIAYYRNESGGIGVFSWVKDKVLEDYEDYQARQLKRCAKCGALDTDATSMDMPSENGEKPNGAGEENPSWMEDVAEDMGDAPPRSGKHSTRCKYCGSTKFETKVESFETIRIPVKLPGPNGESITVMQEAQVPYYKPDIYPVILQKNISIFGQLLGDSDVDKIEDHQNVLNRLAAKKLDLMLNAGSFCSLPASARFSVDNNEMKYVRLDNPVDKQLIDTYVLMPDPEVLNSISAQENYIYEQARQAIGITDSYQGRQDPTATSGKAKEFAAQQSAGRLESKRVMKEAAYQQLFEAIFKFKLAYADEPRDVVSRDASGHKIYTKFDRYKFLKRDADGSFYWNDDFIFSVDSSSPLAKDREAMWQEARMNLQTGAFGDPASYEARIQFWEIMNELHYPSAGYVLENTKKAMAEAQQQQAQQAAMQQEQMQMQQQAAQAQAEAQAVEGIMKEAMKRDSKTKKESANQQGGRQ